MCELSRLFISPRRGIPQPKFAAKNSETTVVDECKTQQERLRRISRVRKHIGVTPSTSLAARYRWEREVHSGRQRFSGKGAVDGRPIPYPFYDINNNDHSEQGYRAAAVCHESKCGCGRTSTYRCCRQDVGINACTFYPSVAISRTCQTFYSDARRTSTDMKRLLGSPTADFCRQLETVTTAVLCVTSGARQRWGSQTA